MNNVLLIDKPKDWTSFDVVAKIRATISKNEGKRIKAGHAGTLDPFATGLLIVLVGNATKKQADFMKLDKEYEATLKLGYVSSTGDPEGKITPYVIPTEAEESLSKRFLDLHSLTRNDRKNIPNKSQITNTLKQFIGEVKQIPPKHSAIKVNGKRAYELARAGKEFQLKPRTITIYQLSVTKYQYPDLQIKIRCSSGTYIRTLAEDIGKTLGCGAYLTALRRTKIGGYETEQAQSIDEIVKSC